MKKIACLLAFATMIHTGGFAGPGNGKKTGTISPVFKVTAFQDPIPANAPGLRKMKTGRTLTILGSVMLVGGIAMAATADSYTYNYSSTNGNVEESGDAKGAFGVLFIAGGIGMIIPGAIMWSKGSKRYKEYKETLSFKVDGTSAGITYRF